MFGVRSRARSGRISRVACDLAAAGEGAAYIHPLRGSASHDGFFSQEFVIAADVVASVVGVRREYEQHGVSRVAILDAPDHRREIHADVGTVEAVLLAANSI